MAGWAGQSSEQVSMNGRTGQWRRHALQKPVAFGTYLGIPLCSRSTHACWGLTEGWTVQSKTLPTTLWVRSQATCKQEKEQQKRDGQRDGRFSWPHRRPLSVTHSIRPVKHYLLPVIKWTGVVFCLLCFRFVAVCRAGTPTPGVAHAKQALCHRAAPQAQEEWPQKR